MKSLENIEMTKWDHSISSEIKKRAVHGLEGGKILYFPHLDFPLSEQERTLLTPNILSPKAKNISYDPVHDRLSGFECDPTQAALLKRMMERYYSTARHFLLHLIPHYEHHLILGKTSFRPVEILGRKTSYRKDDTRLHVDAFPSNPTKGQRILRIFTNINHEGKPRVWRSGEPFEVVVKQFAPKTSSPWPVVPHLLKLFKITKDKRTDYDHYMLQIHDGMKGDLDYQKNAGQEELHFPPGSSWIVFTDQVSHAAMSGQHVLEQTFHLNVEGLQNEATAPLRVLERYFNKALV